MMLLLHSTDNEEAYCMVRQGVAGCGRQFRKRGCTRGAELGSERESPSERRRDEGMPRFLQQDLIPLRPSSPSRSSSRL